MHESITSPANFPPKREERLGLCEVPSNMYCAILGTCLSLFDLVKIGRKAGIVPEKHATDYEVHGWFVQRIGQPGRLGRLIQKHLDKTHRAAIDVSRAARDEAELEEFWKRSVAKGDIAGPFWALVTHPLATEDLRSLAYGEIHMLSHWMGSANRQVSRRLQAVEEQRARVSDRLAGATRRLADREAEHRRRSERQARKTQVLADRLEAAEKNAAALLAAEARLREFERGEAYRDLRSEYAALAAELAEARQERDAHLRKCDALESELNGLRQTHEETTARLGKAEVERAALETVICAGVDAAAYATEAQAPIIDLRGRRVAYVGGREGTVRHFRALIERSNGRFSHHDGGAEGAAARLDRVLHQADVVLCPVDCVSHSACLKAKKFCKRTAKTFVPLRSASLSSLVAGLQLAVDRTGTHTADGPVLDAN